MNSKDRIAAFVKLGELIKNLDQEKFEEIQWRAQNANNWFTVASVSEALKGITLMLDSSKLNHWLSQYDLPSFPSSLKVGVLMAGNIPAVGFHDLMCVLLSGHIASVKLSSTDSIIMKWLIFNLIKIEPRFEDRIEIEEMLKGKDAYIATGSDNSSRYFNYYFGKYPHVIRQNRTSVAVLYGDETIEDYLKLGKDVFQYFGLGCRNVSKIFLKNMEQLQGFLGAIEVFNEVSNHHKYHNNYDYNKSIYLVNGVSHLDNGFLLLTESEGLVSPISVLFFEIYDGEEQLKSRLLEIEDKIQCIVSKDGRYENSIPFGTAQCPEPWDYADGVDTLKFLCDLV
jgi:hypothetical protein